ncbi:MAG: helix-turn-helix domain-containing protein [Bacteroidetes bacterium]|nr:helix-turn-helix domain-containing protein [Bacteroidota bacterium]
MDNSLINLSPAELAAKCINQTNKPVFLTGKAGTGKTTFLRNIIEHTHKNAIIVAPTGIAAINAGGVTIHSQFGVPFGLFVPDSSYKIENTTTKINTPYTLVKHLNMRDQKRKLLQELELLIIDEVSMLRADLLDTIDFVLRSVRRQQHRPFGGVQVLFIGDLMQLPPVVKEEEWTILRNFYSSIYFFDAQVLRTEKPVYIELDKIYRQSDHTFIDLLNNLRNNKVTQANIDLLNSYYKPGYDLTSALNTITLTTHNTKADTLNRSALQELKGKSYFYSATIDGEFSEYAYPVEAYLELKEGAQIMFIKNDVSGKQQYFNGKIGIVSHLNEKEIEIDFKDGTKPFILEKYEWKNIKYELNPVTNEIDETEIGTFIQYPIKLAWAITVHKSQGLTFERAILDINRAFAPGQVYVALSRLKSLDGLVLTSPIQFNAISQDRTLVEYADNKPKTEEVKQLIDQETVFFLKAYVLKAYDFVWLYTCLKNHEASYTMAENKSTKQKHHAWAKDLLGKFEPLKLTADKFSNQLMQIFESRAGDYLQTVHARHIAAKNYFYPVLKELSKSILVHIELLKEEKQIKTYLEELLELEGLLYKHLQMLDKVSTVIDNVLHNTEFTREQLKHNANQQERLELVRQTIAITEKAAFEERKTAKATKKKTTGKVKKEKVVKEPKPDTKEISFNLYKQGKMPEEIANERGLGLTTIETHLAHYVSLGMIPVTQFISKKKLDVIIECSKNHDGVSLTPIKQELGDKYSYSDIRFALATRKYLKNV